MNNELKARQFFPDLALVAGLAAAYFIAAKLGLRLAFVNASATAVWPPTGIALAAFLLLGRRAAPGIWLGAFLANVTTAGSIATSLAIATGNMLEGLIGAYLVTRSAPGREVFNRPGDIFKFVILAALGGTLVSATVGVTSLALAGFAEWSNYGSIWLTWWLGDAAGAIVVTPVLVLWFVNPRARWDLRQALELSLLLVSLVLAGLLIFSEWSPFGIRNYPLQFICIPFLIWAAFRFGQREVAALLVVLSGIAIWGTLNGFGPFVENSQNEALLLLQAFMGVVTVTALILAAVVAERNRLYQAARAANVELVSHVRERTVQLEAANRVLHQEINERRRTEDTRRESEQLLRLLMEGVRDYAIFILDPQGRIISWNAGARRLKGYSAEEVIGQSFSIFYTPEDIAAGKPQQLLDQAANEGRVEDEGWRIRKDGTRFWADAVVTALRDSQERLRGFAKITRDMTERRRAAEALQKQTALYENLLNAQSDLGDGLTITEGARILYANEALSKIYGYSLDELLALGSFLDLVAPEERERLSERLGQRLRGENLSDQGETVVIHKAGHRVYVEYALKLMQSDGQTQLFSIIRDITERKQAEAALQQANARLTDLVTELEAFSYSVSHDLRAPLRVMQGFASTLLEDYKDRLDASGLDFARRIVDAAQNMDHLIRDLLAYSRLSQAELNLGPVDLRVVITEALAELKTEIEARHAQVAVVEPLPRVVGHPGILVQVIQNLLSNAIKFMPPHTYPQVQVWAETRPSGIRLWVKDNGLGIAVEHHERIFRVFERLHDLESYPGTGVGLALVYKGVKRLGGRVGVESEIGQGSQFWLELPRAEA